MDTLKEPLIGLVGASAPACGIESILHTLPVKVPSIKSVGFEITEVIVTEQLGPCTNPLWR